MRAISYNILTGGRDGLRADRLPLIAEVLRRENPDIVALQECNHFDADHHAIFHWFERELGMRGLLARATSGFHVALYVRDLAVVESCEVNQWCQHAMLQATVLVGGQPMQVHSVHHNPFSGTARLNEAEWLGGWSRPETHQLLLGDFNANSPLDAAELDASALPPRYRVRQTLRETKPLTLDTRSISTLLEAEYVDLQAKLCKTWTPTVPTKLVGPGQRFPMRIDFAFASKSLAERATSCRVVNDALADQASDHYPLVVDFKLG